MSETILGQGDVTPATGGDPQDETKTWTEGLPEDIKSHPSLKPFKDVAGLAKLWISAQKMIGSKGVIPPTDKSTDEEWQTFFKNVGLPEDEGKYEVKLPEGAKADPEFIKGLKSVLHKSGVLPRQANALVGWYLAETGKKSQAVEQQKQEETKRGVESLKQEWGQGFEKNVSAAKFALEEFGHEGLKEHLDKTGLGNDPHIIRLLAKMGSTLGEDKIKGSNPGAFGMTPAEINQKINTIMADANSPFNNASHPNHEAAVNEVFKMRMSLVEQ